MAEFELPGLEGTNPLAFLAALGTLKCSTEAFGDQVRMRWTRRPHWHPVLSGIAAHRDGFVRGLFEQLQAVEQHRVIGENPNRYLGLNIPEDAFRRLAEHEIEKGAGRGTTRIEFIAALGSDAVLPDGSVANTLFHMMTGQQRFLENVYDLCQLVTPEDIEIAMFQTWRYEDSTPYLRLDPCDDRRYARRWEDPSKSTRGFEIRTVRGGNRLAIEGLLLFPVIPTRPNPLTVGFRRIAKKREAWRWPVWKSPVSLSVATAVVANADLQIVGKAESDRSSRERLQRHGIAAVFESERVVTAGSPPFEYRNFTPGRLV